MSVALLAVLLTCGCETPSPGTASSAVVLTEPAVLAVPLPTTWPAGVAGTLVFHSDRDGRHKLFTLDLATGVVTRLTEGRDHHDEDAAWSPDGTRLAFTTTRFDARTWHIGVAGAAAHEARQVTNHPSRAWRRLRDPDHCDLVLGAPRPAPGRTRGVAGAGEGHFRLHRARVDD